MAMSEAKKQEMENNLREAGYMGAEDHVEEYVQGDLWSLGSQTRGWFYFTKERMIFCGGLFGTSNFSISYGDIKEIKKCTVGLFIPTGVLVSAVDAESGKMKKYKCSVMKRNKWIEFLCCKSGVVMS